MPVILIADDDATDREHARRCLEAVGGLHITYASNGEEALDMIAASPPDLVVTDLRMPRLDGLELVRQVAEVSPGLPVILMTSHGSERVAADALRSGAASYVPKAELEASLAETVVQVLDVAGARLTRRRALSCLARSETEFVLSNDLELVGPVTSYLQEALSGPSSM